MKNRIIEEAIFIIKNDATIRETANNFNVSKSYIHKIVHTKLKKMDTFLYYEVIKVFKKHNIKKHINGGLATKNKYKRRII